MGRVFVSKSPFSLAELDSSKTRFLRWHSSRRARVNPTLDYWIVAKMHTICFYESLTSCSRDEHQKRDCQYRWSHDYAHYAAMSPYLGVHYKDKAGENLARPRPKREQLELK